uniref:Neprosin PEP catalytic domain-containing protein n=1 Tax=Leersia perrieri TaxID=77586 RepID=A0A0D9WLQ0_9ORYZ
MEPTSTAAATTLFLVGVALLLVSDDGDVIDCVDMYQQPALKDVPGHKMQTIMKPTRSMKEIIASSGIATRTQGLHQTWRKRGSCPAGTVPIRRPSTNADPAAAERARRAFSSGHSHYSNQSATINDCPGNNITGILEVAAAYGTNGPYLGARAIVELWNLDVHPEELYMHYIMVAYTLDPGYTPGPSVDPPQNLTNQIIVGLVNDGGLNNNCFNLDCGGFHLVNSSHTVGSLWRGGISEPGGDKFGVTFGIHRTKNNCNLQEILGDPTNLVWWVSVMDEEIGYYPESLFRTRFQEVSYVELGGRVVDRRPGGKHTKTPMGSGMLVCGGSHFAGTIIEYQGVGANGEFFLDSVDRTVVTTPFCYNAQPVGFGIDRPGYYVAYGGPGGTSCDTYS